MSDTQAQEPLEDDDILTFEDEIEANLKSCPRCGDKARLDDGMKHGIHCDGCGYWTGEDMELDEAIDWWNEQPLIEGLRARLAELERERDALAAQVGWLPVEDGEYDSFMYVDDGGKLLGIFAGDDYTDWYATHDLPDDIRLCRRTTEATGGNDADQ